MDKRRNARIWAVVGVLVISGLGTLFHYGYALSGNSAFAGLVFPVNESVWEHLKMGLWGVAAFSLLEYWFVRRQVCNYLFAKAAGIITLCASIPLLFYSYTAILGQSILPLDIGTFILATSLCQFFTFKLTGIQPIRYGNTIGLITVLGIALTFAWWTYHPPHSELFRDHNTDTYGIEWEVQP